MVGFENDDSMDLPESENIRDRLAALSENIENVQAAIKENGEVLRDLCLILKIVRRSMLWYYSSTVQFYVFW